MLITEGQLRLIIREELIREVDESPVLYTGIVLKPDFVYALRDMIIGLGYDEDIDGWELSNIAAHGNEQLNHHMTLTVDALKPNDPLKDSLGKEVKLQVIGWGSGLGYSRGSGDGWGNGIGVGIVPEEWQVKRSPSSQLNTSTMSIPS